uniref:EF-hand domain-containing protein n=1 Tax=Chromera velia CCMP2878 TaxID=1169474 RepID=A0A0G4FHI3_9ALVE|eukprot:Cvel_16881.t1-p1 / transcript=Cvel_16881.t1 / gene=Cvel_16881 / organism=Chromera_velia_CCMP2878 / gene_product=hypothetical protein / transcript_product=hypothetical protein / location=Cvel_scaffold1321:16754-18962(-) / protein_length=271 / sequence_SO=supercontig / SO=protein_coding / is_pseudo=false
MGAAGSRRASQSHAPHTPPQNIPYHYPPHAYPPQAYQSTPTPPPAYYGPPPPMPVQPHTHYPQQPPRPPAYDGGQNGETIIIIQQDPEPVSVQYPLQPQAFIHPPTAPPPPPPQPQRPAPPPSTPAPRVDERYVEKLHELQELLMVHFEQSEGLVLKERFDELDTDKSGYLNASEFYFLLQKMEEDIFSKLEPVRPPRQISAATVEREMRRFDQTKDGRLSRAEFLEAAEGVFVSGVMRHAEMLVGPLGASLEGRLVHISGLQRKAVTSLR